MSTVVDSKVAQMSHFGCIVCSCFCSPSTEAWTEERFKPRSNLLDSVSGGTDVENVVFCNVNALPFVRGCSGVGRARTEGFSGGLVIQPHSTLILKLELISPELSNTVLSRRNVSRTQLYSANEATPTHDDTIQMDIQSLELVARHHVIRTKKAAPKQYTIACALPTELYLHVPATVSKFSAMIDCSDRPLRLFFVFLRTSQLTHTVGRSAEKKFLRPPNLDTFIVSDTSEADQQCLLDIQGLNENRIITPSKQNYIQLVQRVLRDSSYSFEDWLSMSPTRESFGFITLLELSSCRRKPQQLRMELGFLLGGHGVSNLYLVVVKELAHTLTYAPKQNVYSLFSSTAK